MISLQLPIHDFINSGLEEDGVQDLSALAPSSLTLGFMIKTSQCQIVSGYEE